MSSVQVTTSNEQQATESSLCERNTTAGLSTQGKYICSSAEHCFMSFSAHCHTDDHLFPHNQLQWTVRH